LGAEKQFIITFCLDIYETQKTGCVVLKDISAGDRIYGPVRESSVSQPPGRGFDYTGPREVLLGFVILVL